jgi:glutaminase
MAVTHSNGAVGKRFDPIGAMLELIHTEFAGDDRGELATYIPQLATADPDAFGLALAGTAGSLYRAGASDVPFTIQSISKPFVYALAVADLGLEAVLQRVGVEPTGEAFNAISLEPGSGRPTNPMINAGAILTTSLIQAADPVERVERIRDLLSRCAGRELVIDEQVYESERQTGHRNRALAHLMRHAGSLTGDVDEAVDAYFRQCSVLVTAADLAVMAATLGNGGINPRTGEAVIDELISEQVLTVMATCGMYDYSGQWLLRVGLPAKSGVAGGLVAVSPAQFGIGLFSPPLDERGNSVRAVEASRALSERFALHVMHRVRRTAPSISPVDTAELSADDAAVLALHGDLDFGTAERALLALEARTDHRPERHAVVIDVNQVTRCQPVAAALLDTIIHEISGRGVTIVTVDERERRLFATTPEFATIAGALSFCQRA